MTGTSSPPPPEGLAGKRLDLDRATRRMGQLWHEKLQAAARQLELERARFLDEVVAVTEERLGLPPGLRYRVEFDARGPVALVVEPPAPAPAAPPPAAPPPGSPAPATLPVEGAPR